MVLESRLSHWQWWGVKGHAVSVMQGGLSLAQVLDMAVRVCVSWAKERLNRWIQSSLTGIL